MTIRTILFFVGFSFVIPLASARAQFTSTHAQVDLTGQYLSWVTGTSNTTLIAHDTWRGFAVLEDNGNMTNGANLNYKFATDGYVDDWGDNNQTDFFTPIQQTSEYKGSNFRVNRSYEGIYKFVLNVSNLQYRILDVTPTIQPAIWINEIHYDNDSTDEEEGVEVAGTAGFNLSGYELIFYNGASGERYTGVTLTGTIDDEGNGYGALWFPRSSMQNGNDGIALVKTSTAEVLQFISYEGAFLATDDLAVGAYAENLPVQETTTTPLGRSLQLTGSGTAYRDFTWTGPVTHSRGSLNSGQTIAPINIPSSITVTNVSNSPLSPVENEAADILATIIPTNGASNITAAAFYRVGTNGPFTALRMTSTNGTNFATTGSIPGQPKGNKVEYYVFATFDGYGTNDIVTFPADVLNDPLPFYSIPIVNPGEVWINELNYNPTFFDLFNTNEYIEVVGPAGIDIGDWKLKLYDQFGGVYANYVVPTGTALSDDESGFGFWLIGDPGVAQADTNFTHTAGDNALTKNGTIVLLDSLGSEQHSISYGNLMSSTSNYVGVDDDLDFDDLSLGLVGTGNNVQDFVWATNSTLTAHAGNVGQTLDGSTNPPPTILIVELDLDTTVTMVATGVTTWVPTTTYSTNLFQDVTTWVPVPSVNRTQMGGLDTFTFPLPTTNVPVFFAIEAASP